MENTNTTHESKTMTRGTLKTKENGAITWGKNVELSKIVERFEKLGECSVYSRTKATLKDGQAPIHMRVVRFCGGILKAEFWPAAS